MNSAAKPTSFQRFVLLALAELDAVGKTPVFSYDVKRRCERRLGRVDEPFGGVTRCDVIRALEALASAGLVEHEVNDREMAGMGRPRYALAVTQGQARRIAEGDERLGALAGGLTQ